MIDVDFGDLIDFLGSDPFTRSIILYVEEGIGQAKKFMSAVKGFARNKPILVVKPGRFTEAVKPSRSRTGTMVTSDQVYEAAFKRAGVVRVRKVSDLFNVVRVLHVKRLPKGNRLAIVTNASGMGVMAADALLESGGRLATLSEESLHRLHSILPSHWSRANPVDVLYDADIERYVQTVTVCLNDSGVDGVLIIYAQQERANPPELARVISEISNAAWKPLITTWMGGKEAQEGRDVLFQHNVPTYETPEEAVTAYLYLYHYQRSLELLYETPAEIPVQQAPLKIDLKALIQSALKEGREILDEEESMTFLTSYGIPTAKTQVPEDLRRMAEKVDYELFLGSKKDREFGPAILFGKGGIGENRLKDFSIGLPPMNQTLARRLMEETEIYQMIQESGRRPSIDLRQLEQIIVHFSDLIGDFPEIAEIDIHPLVVSEGNVCALGARILLDRESLNNPSPYPHLVITPYPTRHVTRWNLKDGTEILFRPIKPEDEPLLKEMLSTLSEETLKRRFFQVIRSVTHEMLIKLCNIDYDREMAIVAEIREDQKRTFVGLGGLMIEPGFKRGEFGVVVHDDYQGKGIGYKLIGSLIGIAKEKGLEEFYGIVLPENKTMIGLCQKLAFVMKPFPDGLCMLELALR
jgi:acetyltransferase